jgi:hypothetical protein
LKKEQSFSAAIVRLLEYARFAVAGGIAGVATYNTTMLIIAAAPTQSMESIAMGAGAVIATGIVKVLHVV